MTSEDFRRFSQAVLTLQDCQGPADLGSALLAAVSTLCEADSYAVNSIGSEALDVYAASIDFTGWQMEVFNAHLTEHPLFDLIAQVRDGKFRAGRWSDRMTLREFRQKALYHDFFRTTDIQHQLASTVQVNGEVILGLSCNRARGEFREESVQMLELLLPHVQQVTRRMIGQMEVERALALRELAVGGEAVLVVDAEGTLLFATERARHFLHRYFPPTAADCLPPELRAWLRRPPATDARWTLDQPGRRLVCTCGSPTPWRGNALEQMLPGVLRPAAIRCLRLVEHDESKGALALQSLGLTSREAEVLYWMAQGKRNAEISIILRTSPRTVDKHAEHLFAKLDAETRAFAVALAVEKLREIG